MTSPSASLPWRGSPAGGAASCDVLLAEQAGLLEPRVRVGGQLDLAVDLHGDPGGPAVVGSVDPGDPADGDVVDPTAACGTRSSTSANCAVTVYGWSPRSAPPGSGRSACR